MKYHKLHQGILVVFSVLSILAWSSAQADPYFAIDQNDWTQVLADGNVREMTASEWSEYLSAWHTTGSYEGTPYPWTTFYTPQLYVYQPQSYDPEHCYRGDFDASGTVDLHDFSHFASNWLVQYYSYPDTPGMVMAWNPSQIEDSNSASAWVFEYGYDPDLRNTTVEIEVEPSKNITIVSFGFKDFNNKKQAWWWECGAGKSVDGRTKLTMTTDGAGITTVTPQTPNKLLEAGFDITQVQSFMADEQNKWRKDRAVPPPGQTVKKAWNYWYNLLVTPRPVPPPPVFLKWSQPARYINNWSYYWGWDEISVDHNKPLLADDWVCRDDRPVTGIHWWGSFANKDPNLPGWRCSWIPPILNKVRGFHIGIWTDTPGHPQDMNIISHPNQMIWEQYVYNYDVNYVGLDRDPNDPKRLVKDSCFKFSCDLNPNFVQDPCANCVYWLSIAAIYDTNFPDPPYIWGWKTRPHYSKDDAVRITSIQGGGWPPIVGSLWETGNALECPQWCSWDLAFELTSNEDASCP